MSEVNRPGMMVPGRARWGWCGVGVEGGGREKGEMGVDRGGGGSEVNRV